MMFSKRLPHVLTKKDLALIVAPTVAAASRVEFDIAHERMERAFAIHRVADAFYEGFSAALEAQQGSRTTDDGLIDKLSAAVEKKRSRVKPAEVTPAISAALVFLDIETGHAAEMMRNALDSDKGRALLKKGLQDLAAQILRELGLK